MQPNHLIHTSVFTNAVMTADRTSTVVDFREVIRGSAQITWTGTAPVGTIILQTSNDNVTFTDSDSRNVSGNSGSIMWNQDSVGYEFIRFFYDFTSGTGTLNAIVTGKRN